MYVYTKSVITHLKSCVGKKQWVAKRKTKQKENRNDNHTVKTTISLTQKKPAGTGMYAKQKQQISKHRCCVEKNYQVAQ